jgi:capsular polysaccharide export protein
VKSVEGAIAYGAPQLADRPYEANRRVVVCLGMTYSKRHAMRDFFRAGDDVPVFCRSAKRAAAVARARHGAIAVWAAREPADLAATAAAADVPVLRVEDGFIRSVGLGVKFAPAASIVADGRGIYFDPSSASDLEIILSETDFDPALVVRARRLRHMLVERGITKYNVGAPLPRSILPASGRRIFVPGQVEDDRAVLLGGAGIAGNRAFLARVRAENPDAFILYQPHPDIDAGLRPGAMADEEALRFADRIVHGLSSAAIAVAVDEVHTICSLAGFEAVLRERQVVVYGQPFYAGWGLTTDRAPPPRRQRRLSLDELVAGCLILYPRYLDPVTRLPCGPEMIIERLSHRELWQPKRFARLRHFHGAIMRRLRQGRERSAVETRS